MRHISRRTAPAAAALLLFWCAPAAWSAESTVNVWLEVVHASRHGDSVEPALTKMKAKFDQEGFSYRSYKKVSSQQVSLSKGKNAEVKLPNGRTATVKLEEMKGPNVFVRVTVAPLDAVYELGQEGSAFMLVGPHDHGVLIFVLSSRAPS